MYVPCQLFHREIPSTAIDQAVERIIIFRDRSGDRHTFCICKAGRGGECIQERILHVHFKVECERNAVLIIEVGERAEGVAAVNTRLMEIELQEKYVLRSFVPKVIGRTVGVITRGGNDCGELWGILLRIRGWHTRWCPHGLGVHAASHGIIGDWGTGGHLDQ